MENHSPSQDDKPEERNLEITMEYTFFFFEFFSQASGPNTDGVNNTLEAASMERQIASTAFMPCRFDLKVFKTAFGTYNTDWHINEQP
jgi:hypothetical protein